MTDHAIARRALRFLAGAAILAGAGALAAPVHAQASYTFTVNTTADTPDANPGAGYCADYANRCSLRAATQEASSAAYPAGTQFTIIVPGGTYRLTRGQLELFHNTITIDGENAASTLIDGNAGNSNGTPSATPTLRGSRVFYVDSTATPLIERVTVADGNGTSADGYGPNGQGGGIYSSGPLTLRQTLVTNNVTTPSSGQCASGGGLYQTDTIGFLQTATMAAGIDGSTFSYNSANASPSITGSADGCADGGALSADTSSMTLSQSTFVHNQALAGQEVFGGAIDADQNETATNLTVEYNTAEITTAAVPNSYSCAFGGGIASASNSGAPASFLLSGSTVSNNQVVNLNPDGCATGGAIYSGYRTAMTIGPITVIANNAARSHSFALGGGITNEGTLTLGSSSLGTVSVRQNLATATFSAAGAYPPSCPTAAGDSTTVSSCALGGGIFNSDAGQLDIHSAVIGFNRAQALACASPPCAASNPRTVSAAGGGIYNGGPVPAQNLTLRTNSVFAGAAPATATTTRGFALGGGAYITAGGSMKLSGSTVRANTTPGNGGGIYASGATAPSRLNLSTTTVTQNVAGGNGGGIFNRTPITSQSSPIFGNTGTPCPNTVTPCT